MSVKETVKLFKTMAGEFLLTKVVDITDDGKYVIEYPSVIVPIPQQQGQVGFGKFLPFSDYKEEMTLNLNSIAVESNPDEQMLKAYENWITQVKAQESGIVMAGSMPQGKVPGNGSAADFSRLNM